MAAGGSPPAQQPRERGFVHFRNVFSPALIEELRHFVDESEEGVSKFFPEGTTDFSSPSGVGNQFQGDQLAMTFREEGKTAPGQACGSALARLVAWPRAMEALHRCGVAEPKLRAGYILSKGAGGPPLYWHQDWLFGDHAETTTATKSYQLFGMIYLVKNV